MADVDIADVAQTLARVQVNYSYLAQAWYDIFYNPEPMEVEVQFYDENGNSKLYKIPNRASDRALFKNGHGSPEDVEAGATGTIYQDIDTGLAWVKTTSAVEATNGWIQLITQNDLNKIVLKGSQSPEGIVLAPPGTLYINTDEDYGSLYMKRSTTGRTGWERIDSYPTSFMRDIFYVKEGTEQLKLNGICDNATLLTIYVDGIMLNPSKYELYEDKHTVKFLEPLATSESREGSYVKTDEHTHETTLEDIEVIATYYMNIHLDQGVLAEEIRTEAERAFNAANVATTQANAVIAKAEQFSLDIDEATDVATQMAVEKISLAYKAEADRLSDLTDTIETNITNMYGTIKDEYRDIQDWYNKTSENKVVCAEIQRDLTAIQLNVRSTAQGFEEQFGANNVMLKKDYVPELERMNNRITSESEKLQAGFKADVARIDNVILTKEDAINTELARLDDLLTTTESELRGVIGSYEDSNQAFHETFLNDLNMIKTQYFHKDYMPIDENGLYRNNKNINTDKRSVFTTNNIEISLRKDISYYTVDLGLKMYEAGSDCSFDFTFKLGTTVKTTFDDIFELESDKDNEGNADTDYPTNPLFQCRVLFKNETEFTPFIDWDTSRIMWLGEEPELEKAKNYLMEFISYDMGATWYAHVLGICQPAVRIDTFTVDMTINCLGIPDNLKNADVQLFYDLDGNPAVYDGTYQLSNGVLQLPKEIARKYRNTTISNVRLRVPNETIYVKHWALDQDVTLGADESYTFNVDWSVANKEQYTFAVTLSNIEIEQYMRMDTEERLTHAEFKDANFRKRIQVVRVYQDVQKEDVPNNDDPNTTHPEWHYSNPIDYKFRGYREVPVYRTERHNGRDEQVFDHTNYVIDVSIIDSNGDEVISTFETDKHDEYFVGEKPVPATLKEGFNPFFYVIKSQYYNFTTGRYELPVEVKIQTTQKHHDVEVTPTTSPQPTIANSNCYFYPMGTLKYIYDEDRGNSGITINYDNISSDIMDSSNVNEIEMYVDNFIKRVQIRHDGLDSNVDESPDHYSLCYETLQGSMVNIILNGSVNVNVPAYGKYTVWQDVYETGE